ncbi:serine hydrolase domain-containing protein, partial [Steroidobacter sp.]|uniref:serine hydrolase domain-containing protein n=1 Tax=Steroidobacter sp. TaxID=1978227 RepID=UPI001A3B75F5
MTENTRARARRWPLGLLAGLCIVVAGGAHASRPVPSAALDRYIEQARRDWQVPGFAVGVIRDGEVVYARGFGVREAGKDTPVDLHTRFQIGSMSKAFTAAALGLLVDDGKLNWDDPVIDHLPWFRLSDPWLTQQVTIRDLVGHRTGISGAYIAPISNNEMVRRARYVEAIAPFRSEYLYSNLMYRVAGAVVAEVSGGTWEEFVRTRMFAPLQMNDSGASPYDFWDAAYVAPCMYCQAPAGIASFSQARVTNVAMPHRVTPTGPTPLPWQSIGQDGSSGALVASVTDMLMWLQMNLRNGEYHGKRFLREATLRELHATQMQPRTDYDWIKTRIEQVAGKPQYAPGYAMGWRTSQYRNLKLLDHTGALAANRAYGALLPERGMGVVILANAPGRGSGGMHEAIALRVLDLLLGAPAHDWSRDFLEVVERGERERETAEQRLQQSKLPGTRPSLPLESYGGEYQNDWFGR